MTAVQGAGELKGISGDHGTTDNHPVIMRVGEPDLPRGEQIRDHEPLPQVFIAQAIHVVGVRAPQASQSSGTPSVGNEVTSYR